MLRYLKSLPPPTAKTLYVVGNQSADMDSCCSAIVASYFFKSPEFDSVQPCIDIPRAELRLRPDIQWLFQQLQIPLDKILFKDDLWENRDNHLFLVDHNSPTVKGKVYAIIDHHQPEGKEISPDGPKILDTCGSCMSLIIDRFKQSQGWDDHVVCALGISPILQDTRNLTQEDKTTEIDVKSYDFVSKNVSFDIKSTFKTLKAYKKDLNGFTAVDLIKKDFKQWGSLGISSIPALFEVLMATWPDLPEAMKEFKKEANLSELICLASGSKSDKYVREFGIVGNDLDVAKNCKPLELKLVKEINGVYIFNQGVTTANRKVVGPLMRKLCKID